MWILKADLGVSKMVQQAKASASKPPDTLVFSAHMVGRELALAGCPLTSSHAPRCKNPLINELWFDQMVLLDRTDFRTRMGTRHADVLLMVTAAS